MGLAFSRLFKGVQLKREIRVIIVGLSGAGKTTFLYRLKLGEIVQTIPTIGFNVEMVDYRNTQFTIWDIGGLEKIRILWPHYYQGTQAVIFMVDSNDRNSMQEARDELYKLIENEDLQQARILVLANKQDLDTSMPINEISSLLGLHGIRGKQWHIQGVSTVNGEGIYEALDWIFSSLIVVKD